MMRLRILWPAMLLTLAAAPPVHPQAQVDVAKRATLIPKVCENVVPASIDGAIDIAALVREAYCKGSGDMIIEYSYVMNSATRTKDQKGIEKVETTTYEVLIPTLKGGLRARGILVVTNRNGVPVPANELEKARLEAGERLEKEEKKIARTNPPPPKTIENPQTGMMPLGMYTRTTNSRSRFGFKSSAALAIHTFLKSCDLVFARREQRDGRETLVFTFVPRRDAQFVDSEKYVTQLNGEIWIDARDRIVNRLIGWPIPATSPTAPAAEIAPREKPPAVYVEMMRLPEGVWLPHLIRINGADYPSLFDGITSDTLSTFSNYVRFSTDIKDVKVGAPDHK